jgi:hypothetical protein
VNLASRSQTKNWNLRSDLVVDGIAPMDLVSLVFDVLDALSNAHNSL